MDYDFENDRQITSEQLKALKRQLTQVNRSLQDQYMLRNNILTRARMLTDKLDQLDDGIVPDDPRDLTPWEH